MEQSTRTRLMAAAERILVERGVNALSVRKIGDAAGLNPTLVTYHFGSLVALLDELCSANLDPLLDDWSRIAAGQGAPRDFDEVLKAWLVPMLRPCAFTPEGRALTVLDELAAHGEPALQARILSAMEAFALRLRSVLAPLIPALSETELRARLRFISGAVLGPPPRAHRAASADGAKPLGDIDYLLPFARAALSG